MAFQYSSNSVPEHAVLDRFIAVCPQRRARIGYETRNYLTMRVARPGKKVPDRVWPRET